MRLLSNKKVAFVALCITLFGASAAYAQQAVTSQAMTDYDDQLALDVTPVPPGSGAIFVPTLSNPKTESHVIVYYQGEKVTSGKTGERIIVPPGEYDVVMATGDLEDAASSHARVVDGATIVMMPFYGGVKLVAVDTQGKPIEVRYGIRQGNDMVVDTTTPIATQPSQVRSYLLRPGPKTWVFADGTEIAFNVPQGQMTAYRAVFDNGKFVGLDQGTAPIEEPSEKWWRARMTIGADVSGSYSKEQLTDFNGIYGQLGAFANLELGVDTGDNLFTLRLGIEESWVMVDSDQGANVPIRSLRDKVKGELLYAYRAWGVFGPFARVTAQSSIFGNKFYPLPNTTYQVDGVPQQPTNLGKDGSVRLVPRFNPLYLEEAVGFNVTVVDNSVFDLVLLGGIAARQNFFNIGSKKSTPYYIKDYKKASGTTGPTVNLVTLKDEMLYGALVEGRLGLRIAQNFRITATGHMFVPYQQVYTFKKGEKRHPFKPLYGFSGLAELNINRYFSIIALGEYSLPNTQMEKPSIYGGGALRFQANLF